MTPPVTVQRRTPRRALVGIAVAGIVVAGLVISCRGDRPSPATSVASTSSPPVREPLDARAAATAEPAPDAGDQWTRVRQRYGRLVGVAGAGATDRRRNEWRPAFEGGLARDAELSRPHFAMADAAGNVYIADKEAHAIRRVGTDGRIVTVAGTGAAGAADDRPGPATRRALANPNGLYVLPDGTLYVVDLDHDRVRKVTPAGEMSTLFRVPGGIAIGRGLWVAADEGEVLLASGTVIKRWTPAGGVEDWATGFSSLGLVVRDHAGRVLAADRGADRVVAITADGAQIVIAGTGRPGDPRDGAPAVATPLDGARAVWPAHPDDGPGFFVGTHEGCQLWFVDEDGVAHLFLDGARDAHAGDGEPFDTPGKKISELRSASLDAAGNVLIVEDDRGFVRRVERR